MFKFVKQIQLGRGDNIAGDKIVGNMNLSTPQDKKSFWNYLKKIGVVIAILAPFGLLPVYKNNATSEVDKTNMTTHLTQVSYGSGDNIGGNKIINNFAPDGRHLTIELQKEITARLPLNSPVTVFSYGGDTEGLNFANEIISYLKKEGYQVGYGSGNYQESSGPVIGLKIIPNSMGTAMARAMKKDVDPGYMLIVGYKPQ